MSAAISQMLTFGVAVAVGLFLIGFLGFVLRAGFQEYGPHRIPCLLYHQLQPSRGARNLQDVDPVYVCFADQFALQMNHLREAGYITLTLDDLVAARRDPACLPPKPVLVTFDDGFGSNYGLAFPVLRRNGQKATIFMTPDREAENFKAFSHLDRPLADGELREMAASGIDIQSHGLSHRFLTELKDAELWRELVEPRHILQRITGRAVDYLAIPGGAYNRHVRQAAQRAGYRAVFCMRKGSASPRADLFYLPRMVVSRDMTLEDFRAMLSPAGCLRGRLISAFQEGISRTLGMRRTDALRNWLYVSPLAPLLQPQRLVWLLLAALTGLAAAVALLARSSL